MTELTMISFAIDGELKTLASLMPGARGGQTFAAQHTAEPSVVEQPQRVAELNQLSTELEQKLERDLMKRLPPHVTVQASIGFEMGSIILTGTVTLLSWGGSIILNALKEEAEQQLASLVSAAVKRGVRAIVGNVVGLDVQATPRAAIVGNAGAPIVSSRGAPNPAPEAQPHVIARAGAAVYALGLVAVVFAIQLAMLADRFLVVQLKP